MMKTNVQEGQNALFVDFVYLLRDYGVPASLKDLLEVNDGLEKGLVENMDDLFVFLRLAFVRRVEHMDAFERAFLLYFYGVDVPAVAEGDPELLRTKQFQKWLNRAIESGELPKMARYNMSPEELMEKFWERIRAQTKEHHGGSKWVGTAGNSPFGHSGNAEHGIRMGGQSGNRRALKVLGERRYIDYAQSNELREENLRQALESMKHLKQAGPKADLDLDETIARTAKNGGEIELVFRRDLRDRIRVLLLIDNGGYSMTPFVDLTRLLFSKLHGRFDEIETYYFHNTIFNKVYSNPERTRPFLTEKLLQKKQDTRVVIVGDATMGPHELRSPYGSIYSMDMDDPIPSIDWLERISQRFPKTVWLNPIPKEYWGTDYGSWTLQRIREVFHMEDMTLGGLKGMVEYLSDLTGKE